jgi:hypothetical protein
MDKSLFFIDGSALFNKSWIGIRRLWNHQTRRNLEPHKNFQHLRLLISDAWRAENGRNLPFVQTDWLAPAKF